MRVSTNERSLAQQAGNRRRFDITACPPQLDQGRTHNGSEMKQEAHHQPHTGRVDLGPWNRQVARFAGGRTRNEFRLPGLRYISPKSGLQSTGNALQLSQVPLSPLLPISRVLTMFTCSSTRIGIRKTFILQINSWRMWAHCGTVTCQAQSELASVFQAY